MSRKKRCERENTLLAKNEVEKLEEQIAQIKEELSALRAQWEHEKKMIESIKEKKDQFEKLRFQEEEAERRVDYNRVAELRYNIIPEIAKRIRRRAEKTE